MPNSRKSPGRAAKGNVTGASGQGQGQSGQEGRQARSLGRIGLMVSPGLLTTEKLRQPATSHTQREELQSHLHIVRSGQMSSVLSDCVSFASPSFETKYI